eukprot:1137247-Pelagomonas_calceolata.AAC.2
MLSPSLSFPSGNSPKHGHHFILWTVRLWHDLASGKTTLQHVGRIQEWAETIPWISLQSKSSEGAGSVSRVLGTTWMWAGRHLNDIQSASKKNQHVCELILSRNEDQRLPSPLVVSATLYLGTCNLAPPFHDIHLQIAAVQPLWPTKCSKREAIPGQPLALCHSEAAVLANKMLKLCCHPRATICTLTHCSCCVIQPIACIHGMRSHSQASFEDLEPDLVNPHPSSHLNV